MVQIMRPTAATLDSKDDLFDPPDARREKMPTFRANYVEIFFWLTNKDTPNDILQNKFEFLKICYMFFLRNSISIDTKMPLKLLLEKSKPPKQGLINGAVRFQRAPFDCLKSSPICG